MTERCMCGDPECRSCFPDYLYYPKEDEDVPDELLTCCLCDGPIDIEPSGWAEGNNAEPLAEGRCCNHCNWSKVVPARLEAHMAQAEEREDR